MAPDDAVETWPSFPYRTISFDTTPELHQADCQRCGWHTRQSSDRSWIASMAKEHHKVCPNPYYRNGSLMECGCWYACISPGSAVGEAKAECPLHGETVMAKANVKAPIPFGMDNWIVTDA